MNENTIRSILTGMENTNYGRGWNKNAIVEAMYVLENKEELLRDYDCYDYLFN